MSRETRFVTHDKRAAGGDLVIPLAGLGFTLYYFSTIVDSPWTAQVSAFFIGAVLIGLITVLLVRTTIEWRRGQVDLGMGGLLSWADVHAGRVALLLATLAFVVLIEWVGFTLATLGFLLVSMAVLNRGRRLGFVTLISTAISMCGYVLFIVAFETRFPRGPFERMMESMW
jgi:hypothetical protein